MLLPVAKESSISMKENSFEFHKISSSQNLDVEEVCYHFVPDAATRLAGLLSGEYDVADDIPAENYKELKGARNVVVKVFTNTNKTPVGIPEIGRAHV